MSEYTSRLEDFEFDEPETAADAGRRMIARPGNKARGKGPSSRCGDRYFARLWNHMALRHEARLAPAIG
jgi:hypothetical protein